MGRIDMQALREKAAGAYLGLAVGDALGVTLEFMTPREIAHRHGVHREISGGGWLHVRPGQVTDDTEMALALGDSIIANGDVDPLAVARAFDAWMRAKPIDIGHTVRRGISQFRRSGQTAVPENEYDAGNGACMRCLPVALAFLWADEARLCAANQDQSHVTHHNRIADLGTLTVLRMVRVGVLGGALSDLRDLADALVSEEPRYQFSGRPMLNPGGYIVETLIAVFQSLFAGNGFEEALVDVVNRGGDADTSGAILGMIAGALYGAEAIPTRWLKRLEPHIRKQCRQQSEQLLQVAVVKATFLGRSSTGSRCVIRCSDRD